MSEPDLHRGARIGTRIAHLVSMALVSTHNKLLDVKHRLAVMIFNTISNEISDEVHDTIGHLIRHLAEQTENGEHSAPLLKFLGYDRGQLKAIAGSSTLSSSILWSLSTIINNELAPATYANVAAYPHLAPDSGTAGQMAAVGAVSEGDARYAMAGNGHGGRWQDGFIELGRSYPGLPDLVDMLRRNIISPGDFDYLAKKNGVPPNVITVWKLSVSQPLSYQDVAVAYLRGDASLEAYHEAAKFAGVSVGDANVYLHSIGEPPGTMELLEAYRRGFIDKGTLDRGILQSRTRNEWIPVIEQLRYSPMSTADAVNAAVQNHISQGEAASIAQQNGLEPGHFDTLYQTAGAPLSRTELTELYNRG